MGSFRMTRALKLVYLNALLIYFICNLGQTLAEEEVEAETLEVEKVETSTRNPVKLSAVLRNISLNANVLPLSPEVPTISPRIRVLRRRAHPRLRSFRELNQRAHSNSSTPQTIDSDVAPEAAQQSAPESFRESKSFKPAVSKISGIVEGGKQNPQDLIRNALLNHTLEHGGEQDLDKLVFSNLPNGRKLVLRTVKIIRTDGDGNPLDGSEDAQPTYWDVTLANATELHPDGEEDGETEESDESEEEEISGREREALNGQEVESGPAIPSPVALKSTEQVAANNNRDIIRKKVRGGRKKPDLESSGSHSAANYHLNGYGTADREKEHGTTHFHGNTHGNTHKKTYTETDGKDVKPYHGTENGLTDHANDHGKNENNKGERYKSSKRKNKGRKVTGFKRVYHKEEYQRTEHFFDDEEAKKIAESFGLSEAKEADNHGTKGDKRKYHGVHTEYLDGKKHENEHGTHDGYNKGQHTTYKDNEKHRHHSNYGKSQSHGTPPQSHHNHGYDYQQNHHTNNHPQQQHLTDYHPNHNYHASYSNPKKTTIPQVPKELVGQLGGTRSLAAIISAPMAHSFTVTEYSPLVAESISTPNPLHAVTSLHEFNASPNDHTNFTSHLEGLPNNNQTESDNDDDDDDMAYSDRRHPSRKRPRQRKIYFSPKYRPVKEDVNLQNPNEQSEHSLPKNPIPVTYHVASVSDIINSVDNNKDNGQIEGEKNTKYTPYAPNFGPPPADSQQYIVAPQDYNRDAVGRYPKSWRWLARPRQQRPGHRPRPVAAYSPLQMQQLLSHQPTGYPRVRNQMHLAGIPLRHASAFHRLGNRHHRYSTLKHHPKQHHPYEISTRKSDSVEYDRDNGTSLHSNNENDSAHYFNHNHRYAKNHLTSTIDPLESNNNDNNEGVRNTLFDPVPGVYSTVVKVFPATMIHMNDSTTQSSGLDQRHAQVSGHPSSSLTVTQRPFNQVDMISITTAYPQLHPSQSQQQALRPFIPKKKYLTFTFNLGNPEYKLGNDFGPSQHPFGHNGQKASYIMQGIKNGLLKPFRRAQGLLAAPTAISHQNYHRPRIPLQYTHNNHHIVMHHRPHPIFAHNVVSYDNFGDQSPAVSDTNKEGTIQSVAPSSSVIKLLSTSPSPAIVLQSGRPKFYYKPNDTPTDDPTVTTTTTTGYSNRQGQVVESKGDTPKGRRRHHKRTFKVTSTSTTPATAQTSTTDAETTSTNKLEMRMSGKPPPFINGIMDSVADFFGRMG